MVNVKSHETHQVIETGWIWTRTTAIIALKSSAYTFNVTVEAIH